MNQIARLLPHMTADDFLAWPGDGTEQKFQLIDGELCPVSPAGDTHGTIQTNVAFLLTLVFRTTASGLRAVTEAQIIPGLNPSTNVRVPNVVVASGPSARGGQLTPDPMLMVEVLSPGDQRNTRDNIRSYSTLPSVQAMLVVHSTRLLIEVYRRGPDGNWLPEPEYVGAGERLRLPSVNVDCPVEDAYRDTWLLPSTE